MDKSQQQTLSKTLAHSNKSSKSPHFDNAESLISCNQEIHKVKKICYKKEAKLEKE
jgi:hypothetical protein